MRSWWRNSVWNNLAGIAAFACWLMGRVISHPEMVVTVPVSDLRAQPHTAAQPSIHDPLEETQVLYGERVHVIATQDAWTYVEAIEQPEFTHAQRWQGYPGWLPSSTLVPWEPLFTPTIVVTEKWAPTWLDTNTLIPSPWQFPLGTRLRATDVNGHLWRVQLLNGTTVWLLHQYARSLEELRALSPVEKRRDILHSAEQLLGDPYYWGGRSPTTSWTTRQITGVDCSGLINLAYRSVGVDIPRDAHEQFLRAQPTKALQLADLIFLSERSNPKHIVHVMLYAGAGEVIEGPGTGMAVRRIALTKRFGRPLSELAPDTVIDGQTVSFGTYLP